MATYRLTGTNPTYKASEMRDETTTLADAQFILGMVKQEWKDQGYKVKGSIRSGYIEVYAADAKPGDYPAYTNSIEQIN